MSVFLINASNLKAGGGLQVADSICVQLNRFNQHKFIVVLSSYFGLTKERIQQYENVEVIDYTIPNTFNTIVLGWDIFLNQIVENRRVEAVLTVFGPSRWIPKVRHLSGFALSQIVIPESPFFQRMNYFERLKWTVWRGVRRWSFKRSADCFWTENPFISRRLKKLLGKNIYTVSNYYNQIFDSPDIWRKHPLPVFEGTTCLSVSSNYPHKNFGILLNVARLLVRDYPEFKFRFVLTFEEAQLVVPEELKHHFLFIGKIDMLECPDLYRQSDIMFMPTLLECFTATYPEAMRMEVPIVTTDLEFARGLCGNAACYYSALDAQAASEAIYKVATDKEFAAQLLANGKEQLKKFDTYEQRANKLIGVMEEMVREKK